MIDIVVQVATTSEYIPTESELAHWVEVAVDEIDSPSSGELTVRMVDEGESADLNGRYRGKASPTNVLSFPFDAPDNLPIEFPLGDLVVCAAVVEKEAREQGKELEAHWAHMVIHGLLHLLGMDHIESAEAEAMESREIAILAKLGFPDPYA